jgi:hypothetical protein
VKPLEISFPLGLEGTDQLPYTKRELVNCWNDNGEIIQRPGQRNIATTGRVARGVFEWNGSFYEVASQELLKFTDVATGAFTSIGTIEGTEDIRITNNFVEATIAVKGGKIYTLDKSDTLTDISGNDNIFPVNSLTTLNSRTIYVPSDGGPPFFSDPNASGTVQALSFFDAEQLPDNNTEAFVLNNILYVAGTESTQAFLDRGLSPVPYVPQTGRTDNGIIGGVVEVQGTVFYIGREKGQDLGIYAHGPGVAPKISNKVIDVALAQYDEATLSKAIANRYKWKGDDVVNFAFGNDSFGFFRGNWFRTDTLFNGFDVPWQLGFVQEFNLKYYSAYAGNFNILDDVNNDAGNAFRRVILGGEEIDGAVSIQNMHYHMSQGFNDNVGSVFLELSDDNILFYPPFAEETGERGNYKRELEWNYPGGALFSRFIGYRISTGEDVNFSGTKLFADVR